MAKYGSWGTPQDEYYQTYRDALNKYYQAQKEGALAATQSAELDLYRYIGLQQQQMEQKIRQRRLQALRSGATSAQLAAQELQTLLAAQQGAQAVAEDYLKQRAAIESQYAGYEYANEIRALEDYAQRMMHAENLQTQYDVARMQTDPSITARYMAESMGYDWDEMDEEQKARFIVSAVTGESPINLKKDRWWDVALAGAGAGAATGAAIGSIVPGLGTGIGAAAGFLIGGAGGLVGDLMWDSTKGQFAWKKSKSNSKSNLSDKDKYDILYDYHNYLSEGRLTEAEELKKRYPDIIGK